MNIQPGANNPFLTQPPPAPEPQRPPDVCAGCVSLAGRINMASMVINTFAARMNLPPLDASAKPTLLPMEAAAYAAALELFASTIRGDAPLEDKP